MGINLNKKIIRISARATTTMYGLKFTYTDRSELMNWSNESRYTSESWFEQIVPNGQYLVGFYGNTECGDISNFGFITAEYTEKFE